MLRTTASNDYPAWGIAIVRLATQTMMDEIKFKELEIPLIEAIKGAKLAGKTQETLLAQVNAQLIVERQKMLPECASIKLTLK